MTNPWHAFESAVERMLAGRRARRARAAYIEASEQVAAWHIGNLRAIRTMAQRGVRAIPDIGPLEAGLVELASLATRIAIAWTDGPVARVLVRDRPAVESHVWTRVAIALNESRTPLTALDVRGFLRSAGVPGPDDDAVDIALLGMIVSNTGMVASKALLDATDALSEEDRTELTAIAARSENDAALHRERQDEASRG